MTAGQREHARSASPKRSQRRADWGRRQRAIEWFRPLAVRRLAAVWLVAGVTVALASLLIGLAAHRLIDVSEWVRLALVIAGAVGVIGAPLYYVVAMFRALSEEVYLLLRSDGLLYQSRRGRTFIAWQQLVQVEIDEASGHLVLHTEDDAAPLVLAERFLGIDPPALVRRIKETQRRALLGMV